MTSCEDVEVALAELALGAIAEPRAADLRAHLRTCAGHPHLRDLVLAVSALAFEPDPVPPPQGLRTRVLSSATRVAPNDRPRGKQRTLLWATSAAAALAIATLTGVLAWSPWSRDDVAPLIAQEVDEERGITIELRRSDAGTSVALLGLSSPPAGMAYQLWLVQNDAWLPVRTFLPDRRGSWQAELALSVAPGDRICITLESAGGAQWPTSAPIVFFTVGQ